MWRRIEQDLLAWKGSKKQLPIILRGARQVGKSYTIEKFGKESFSNIVVANFEFNSRLSSAFNTLDPVEIVGKLEAFTKSTIRPQETLLFLDEIQLCPQAILALRYFKEKMPDLHVIAAGFLLELVLNAKELDFSFPVGRIQFMYLKPLSFQEFLVNLGEEKLIEFLKKSTLKNPLDPVFHERLIELIRQYLLVGGMPFVVDNFIEKKSYVEARQLQNSVLQTYYTDFGKYAKKTIHKHLQELFDKIPLLAGQQFKYASVIPDIRAREIKVALEQLKWMGIIHKVFSNNASGIPLKSQKKEDKFKINFLDVGLLQCANGLDYETVLNDNILQINSGAVAEQFVGQELLAYSDFYEQQELYFWEREKRTSTAEVDYVVQCGRHIIPIKVKAGKTGRLRSLQQFMEEKKSPFGVRISQNPLSFEHNILSIPLYMISELSRLVGEILSK